MNMIHLHGCRAEPLLSYLSGLGVVRLLAEQLDSEVSARWDGEHMIINSRALDDNALVEFFDGQYQPTPLLAPWNGRGGFQDGKERPSELIVRKVERSDSQRLEAYRSAICSARGAWEQARDYQMIEDGKISNKHKTQFIELCRARFTDNALAWLDTSVVLLEDKSTFPLILGTGGNFGSMDASFAFLKYLDELGVLDNPDRGAMHAKTFQNRRSLLLNALFRDTNTRLTKGSAGQFDPGGVGGPNSSSTDDSQELANPWSFVLALEGSMLFASAAARRLGTESQTGAPKASMPFTVNATPVTHDSASESEDLKGELWIPLWRDDLSYREIQHLISEGRSQWGRSQARSGLDFARAASTLGVDRSVDEFVRYLISVRHGQNVLAVHTGRFKVSDRVMPEVDLLRQIDDWTDRARSDRAPSAVKAALSSLSRAQFEVSTLGGAARLQTVLATLAEAEQAAARSPGYRKDRRLSPVAGLTAREWVPVLNDDSAEFRIAVGLASLSDRVPTGRPSTAEAVGGSLATLLRPVRRAQFGLAWSEGGPRVPSFGHRPIFDLLSNAVGARAVLASSSRSREATSTSGSIAGLPFAFDYGFRADLADIGRLLSGQLNEERLVAILGGLLLLEWKDSFRTVADCLASSRDPVGWWHAASCPSYAVLVPFFSGWLPIAPTDEEPNPNESVAVHPRPEWVGVICKGAAHIAARSAAQLLRGRGWELIHNDFDRTNVDHRLLATALLLRLDPADGDQRRIRFLLNQQSTFDTRWSASREEIQELNHEQA